MTGSNDGTAATGAKRRGRGHGERATVRRFFLDLIIKEMDRRSPENLAVLAAFGLDRSKPLNPYATVPLKTYITFYEAAARVLNRPHLGLEIGQGFRIWEIGPVYPLLVTAPSLRGALDVFARFQASWQSHTSLDVERSFDETRYGYRIDDMDIWPRVQDSENAIAGLCALIRQLYTDRWSPAKISFEHDITGRQEALLRYFRCPVEGNAESNGLVMRDSDLDRPITGWLRSDGPARANVERHLFDLLRQPAEDSYRPIHERLAQLINQRLGREPVDLDTMADQLGVAPRTLRRQLHSFGTSFGEVLTRERRRKAEMLLSTGTIKLSQLAAHLGYENQSAFSRAFREWTGETASASLRRARRNWSGDSSADGRPEA